MESHGSFMNIFSKHLIYLRTCYMIIFHKLDFNILKFIICKSKTLPPSTITDTLFIWFSVYDQLSLGISQWSLCAYHLYHLG